MQLSYMQSELLMLRLILISATLFMTFMSLRYPTIFIDVECFNIIFILLNAYLSFKLLMKLIPPKFTAEETKLYNDYFCRYFKPNEFKKLVGIARRRVYRVNSSIVNQGNGFSSLFFVVDIIGDNISLELKSNGVLLKGLSKCGWIGIVEYIEVISRSSLTEAIAQGSDFGTWGVNLDVLLHIEEESEEMSQLSEESAYEEEQDDLFEDISPITKEVILYEFDLESLDMLFRDKEYGYAIKNSLHSIWLLYFSEYIYKFEANKRIDTIGNKIFPKRHGSFILNDSQLSG